jgi:plastocyanin
MSFRSLLPLVTLVSLAIAGPAFPCEGNPNCACNKKDAKAASCEGKCDGGMDCAKMHEGATAAPVDMKGAKVVALSVTEKGFEPASVKVSKGVPLKLVITRKTDHTCAKQIVVKDYGINVELPLNKAVEVALTPKAAGTIGYACSMGMVSGNLIVE